MRSFVRRTFAAALALATAPAWSGCSAKQQTEYVAGISTQVQVPRDLRAVRVSVSIGGITTFCQGYPVYNGVVQLPRSLGAYALNDPSLSGPVSYTIIGYSADVPPGDELNSALCQNVVVGAEDTRILRRSTQPYLPEKILFLPMPLKFSCFDRDCPNPGETCKGGRCVREETDPTLLPEFTPDLLDGTGGACFPLRCLSPAPNVPPPAAVLVNAEDCTYAVANSAGEPAVLPGAPDVTPGESTGPGVNVLVSYDGGLNVEVLDKDLDQEADYPNGVGEGFLVTDAQRQEFRLAPGLCDMVKGTDGKVALPHRITSVRASGSCQAKTKFQPICAADQLDLMSGAYLGGATGNLPVGGGAPAGCVSREVLPPESALAVVVDNSTGHGTFFDQAEAQAVNLSLDDPAFARTSLGLVYSPGTLACLDGPLDVPLGPSREAKVQIARSFAQYVPGPQAFQLVEGAPLFEGALARAYAAIGERDVFRRAVIVFGNRDFNPEGAADQCLAGPSAATPASLAQAAKADDKNIDTYVLLLAKTPAGLDPAAELAQATQIALAGGTTEATDARESDDKGKARDLFQRIVESLSTCVYDVNDTGDDPAPAAESTLSYLDQVLVQQVVIAPGTCGAEGAPGRGWGYGPDPEPGKKRIYLCQDSCADYRDALKRGSDFNLVFGRPAPALPVFAHRPGCVPPG